LHAWRSPPTRERSITKPSSCLEEFWCPLVGEFEVSIRDPVSEAQRTRAARVPQRRSRAPAHPARQSRHRTAAASLSVVGSLICDCRQDGIATRLQRNAQDTGRRFLGQEITRHKELAANMGIAVYLADLVRPWQRCGKKNLDGLVRECQRQSCRPSRKALCDCQRNQRFSAQGPGRANVADLLRVAAICAQQVHPVATKELI
jgi:hypothetical protein